MTERNALARRGSVAALPVLAAALALAGCAGSHVGDAWQCPIAQGQVCESVAAADPVVPETAEPEALAIDAPLYRARDENGRAAGGTPDPETECAVGCGPFAWLARIFAPGPAEGAEAATPGPAASRAEAGTDTGAALPHGGAPASAAIETDPGAGPEPRGVPESPATVETASDGTGPGGPPAPLPAGSDLRADALRTPEVVGRIWIGPFVDAGGVYREAAWVRVVIAPADWKRR